MAERKMSQKDHKDKLKSSTALDQRDLHRQLLDMLVADSLRREDIVAKAVTNKSNDNEFDLSEWRSIQRGERKLTVDELAEAIKALDAEGEGVDLGFMNQAENDNSPLLSSGFYDMLRNARSAEDELKTQLEELREDAKKEAGFFTTAFNMVAHRKPVSKLINDVVDFQNYCRRNNITFDDIDQQLKPGAKPPPKHPRLKKAWDKIKEFRFLIAAGAGIAIGLAGLNVAAAIPALAIVPTAFFKALPYIAVPYIGLNIFKAFSKKSILKEAGTFARFGVTMAAGFAIALGVTSAMSGVLNPVDMTGMAEAANATGADGGGGKAPFNPAQYIMHGIVFFAGFAAAYKAAKKRLNRQVNDINPGATGANDNDSEKQWKQVFNKVSGAVGDVVANKYTAPAIEKIGKMFDKMGNGVEKLFGGYMNGLGIPAIFLMMSSTIATGGLAALGQFAGYYGTIFAGLGVAAVGLGLFAYAYGCRRKEFKAIAKTAGTAFGISSSAATMPVTKESLKEMGISEKTRESVVPLGANFNMMGTALYLGATAAAAATMFGLEPTLMDKLSVFSVVLATAFGAPGAPSSNIALMEGVLQKTGLNPMQAQKMYEIVLPLDRLFDMTQTSLNVTGDMMVALSKDRTFPMHKVPVLRKVFKKWAEKASKEEKALLEEAAKMLEQAEKENAEKGDTGAKVTAAPRGREPANQSHAPKRKTGTGPKV